jgi:hypothetical protein
MIPEHLPKLTALDLSAIENPHYHHAHDPPIRQNGAYERHTHSDHDDEESTQVETPFETVPLYRRLSIRIREQFPHPQPYRKWGWPTTGAISTFSPCNSGELACSGSKILPFLAVSAHVLSTAFISAPYLTS